MEIQDVNFRTQIAEELSRTELIDRLCEYHETIIKLKDQISSYYDDDDDDYEPNYDNFDCTCGAWKWSNQEGKPIHVADCCCGSSEPW